MIRIDIPGEWLLNANQKLNRWEKAKRARNIRELAYVRTQEAIPEGNMNLPFVDQVRCVVEIRWPDGRRRDAHNLQVLKPCIDGIVDAGVLADDDDAHLIGPDLRVSSERCAKGLACSLGFRFEDAP